ncbi:alpha/beta hydrolase [Kosakonia sp. H02]|nr:alpha/beta hydrolase [Kosakonia sp. H02]
MKLKSKAVLSIVAATLMMAGVSQAALAKPVKNIVLVHGAFVDGSGWRPVYDILNRDGYKVTLVQEPLTSFADDVAATKRILDRQDGPVILVGHSYGGAIITQAGNDPKVAGLVYIAAHALDAGENRAEVSKKYPNSAHPFIKTSDGYVMLDPQYYPGDFAADLPREQAQFEAQAQIPTSPTSLAAVVKEAAWRTKPSWYMVAKSDKIINPDLERMYAKRAKSYTVEVEGSHAIFQSRPNEVAKLIEQAANSAQK